MKLSLNTAITLADGSQSDVIKELSLIGNQPSAADAELEALAEEALEADMAAKAAIVLQASTKAAFKEALEKTGKLNGDTKAVGIVRTIIKRTRRFDPSLAEQLLTPEEVAQYSAISGALVKANVAPAAYELMQSDQGFSLELKVDNGR